jgi:hypothetical protein
VCTTSVSRPCSSTIETRTGNLMTLSVYLWRAKEDATAQLVLAPDHCICQMLVSGKLILDDVVVSLQRTPYMVLES